MKRPQVSKLADIARKFRDGFTYDPGHSDLDNEQPIHVHVTLGDWRLLNFVLNQLDSPDGDGGEG